MTSTCMALVLDFGGVISRTVFETQAENERALGLPPGTLKWRGPFDPHGDPLWMSMQAGEIAERDYWYKRARETGDLIGESWTEMQQFLKRIRSDDPISAIRPEAIRTIGIAKQAGKKLAILSNELDLFHGAEFRHKLPFLKSFDVIVDGTYTGILKPEARAYQLVTDALSAAPQECVFVDDQLKNIHGAEAFGMRTVHFDVKQPTTGYREALRLLGLKME